MVLQCRGELVKVFFVAEAKPPVSSAFVRSGVASAKHGLCGLGLVR